MQERRATRRITEPISNLLEENARDARNRAEESAVKGLNGIRHVQVQLVSAAQENVNVLFEYVQDVLKAQSMEELAMASTSYSRRQFEMTAEQAHNLANVRRRSVRIRPDHLLACSAY
jgi:hypothetical protein